VPFFSYSPYAGSCLFYVITGGLGGSNVYPSCDSVDAGMFYCHAAA